MRRGLDCSLLPGKGLTGIIRIIVSLAATAGMLLIWIALAVVVMYIALYICRFLPMVGRIGRSKSSKP